MRYGAQRFHGVFSTAGNWRTLNKLRTLLVFFLVENKRAKFREQTRNFIGLGPWKREKSLINDKELRKEAKRSNTASELKKTPGCAFNDMSSLRQRRGSSWCRHMFLTLPNKYQLAGTFSPRWSDLIGGTFAIRLGFEATFVPAIELSIRKCVVKRSTNTVHSEETFVSVATRYRAFPFIFTRTDNRRDVCHWQQKREETRRNIGEESAIFSRNAERR